MATKDKIKIVLLYGASGLVSLAACFGFSRLAHAATLIQGAATGTEYASPAQMNFTPSDSNVAVSAGTYYATVTADVAGTLNCWLNVDASNYYASGNPVAVAAGENVLTFSGIPTGTLHALICQTGTTSKAKREGSPGYDMVGRVYSAECGNGLIEAGETCDDGNADPGDGCSAACAVESGWTCSGTPSTCTQGLGDTRDAPASLVYDPPPGVSMAESLAAAYTFRALSYVDAVAYPDESVVFQWKVVKDSAVVFQSPALPYVYSNAYICWHPGQCGLEWYVLAQRLPYHLAPGDYEISARSRVPLHSGSAWGEWSAHSDLTITADAKPAPTCESTGFWSSISCTWEWMEYAFLPSAWGVQAVPTLLSSIMQVWPLNYVVQVQSAYVALLATEGGTCPDDLTISRPASQFHEGLAAGDWCGMASSFHSYVESHSVVQAVLVAVLCAGELMFLWAYAVWVASRPRN